MSLLYIVKRPDGTTSKPIGFEQLQSMAETGLLDGCTVAVHGTGHFVTLADALGNSVPTGHGIESMPEKLKNVDEIPGGEQNLEFDLPSPEELELPDQRENFLEVPSDRKPEERRLEPPDVSDEDKNQLEEAAPPQFSHPIPAAVPGENDAGENIVADVPYHGEDGYSIKNPDGLILGPLSIQEVTELVGSGGLSKQDPVSIGGSEFQPADQLPELAILFERRGPRETPSRSEAEPSTDPGVLDLPSMEEIEKDGAHEITDNIISKDVHAPAIDKENMSPGPVEAESIVAGGGSEPAIKPGEINRPFDESSKDDAVRPAEASGEPEASGDDSDNYTTPQALWPELSGRLEDKQLPAVIFQIYKERRDGVLKLERGKDKKSIFFKQGKPVRVQSTIVGERFGDVLVQRKLLTEDQLLSSLDSAKQNESYLGTELVRQGFLSAPLLFEMLGDIIKNQIVSSFSWKEGLFSFQLEKFKSPEHVAAEVDPIHLLRDGIARHFDLRRLLGPSCLGRIMDKKVMITDPSGNALQELKLPPREFRLASKIEAGSTIREVYESLHKETREEVKAARLLFLLISTEVVSTLEEESDDHGGEEDSTIDGGPGLGEHTGFTGEVDFGNVDLSSKTENDDDNLDLLTGSTPGSEIEMHSYGEEVKDVEKTPVMAPDMDVNLPLDSGWEEEPEIEPEQEQPMAAAGFELPEQEQPMAAAGFELPEQKQSIDRPEKLSGTAASQGAGRIEEQRKEFLEFAKDLDNKSYFEIMDVPKDCTDQQVKTSYMALVKKYHPDAGGGGEGVPDDIRRLKEQIFARISEAFEVLKDPEKREAYRVHIEGGGDTSELSGDKVDVSPIFQSEELFLQGKRLIKGQKFAEAVKRIEEALELYDREPSYHAHLAYAKMMRDGPSDPMNISRTAKTLVKILEASPNMEDGWMLLGYVYKRAGQIDYALQTFEKALEINRHNNEAASEVHFLRKKRERGEGKKKGLFK
ncbi:MAG: DnaJ domain-containing protein [Deltaproteobacteria bacterium]|nr:DnaJ domain-containing protein [Deltaproteobacteria bacterium]